MKNLYKLKPEKYLVMRSKEVDTKTHPKPRCYCHLKAAGKAVSVSFKGVIPGRSPEKTPHPTVFGQDVFGWVFNCYQNKMTKIESKWCVIFSLLYFL